MKIFIKRLFCKHEWYLYRTIHGDERNYATQEHRCKLCGKHRYSGGNYNVEHLS